MNLAGVEIILNMREKMDAMQKEFERFFDYIRNHAGEFARSEGSNPRDALVPVSRVRRSQFQQVLIDDE